MAVIAKGQITLTSVIDVKATYRYYLLQSSTLTKPSKPTTYPPSSSWDDTEPTYTDGSTSSLYIVDCTVFSNNTFAYSEVSLSSSYEAAKAAYNKATNAQNGVNNLAARVTNAEATITSNTNAIKLAATKTEVATTLGSYYTKTQTDAAITTKSDSILSTVSSTYSTITDVDNITDDIADAKTKADDTQSRLTVAESEIRQLADSIVSIVKDSNGTSKLVQSSSGWTFDIDQFQSTVQNNLTALTNNINNASGTISKIQLALAGLEAKGEYIHVGTYDGEPCLIFGEDDSEYKLLITNTRLIFLEGSNEPLVLRDGAVVAENVRTKELQQTSINPNNGTFVWKVRDNGNYGLSWKGGVS